MKSIDVKDFIFTIHNFIEKTDMPLEVKRMALKEIYDDISIKAQNECIEQAQERENKDA